MLEAGLARRAVLAGPLAAALAAAIRSDAVVASPPADAVAASPPGYAPRAIPARQLPVPDTVSPGLQAVIAADYPPGWNLTPQTLSAWRQLAAASAAAVAPVLPEIKQRLKVSVEPGVIAGVKVFTVTPAELPPENRNRLLVHLHGGGYVLFPGEAGAGEAMLMAGYGGFKVISIDYRMAPDFPFPAALDDVVAVWRTLVKTQDPRGMAIFGTSAGGGLTLATVLRARAEGLPLPAAMAPGTPWADLTAAGDSLQANAYVDNVLVANAGWAAAAAGLYAAGHDLRDPFISPIYGDFRDLQRSSPPARAISSSAIPSGLIASCGSRESKPGFRSSRGRATPHICIPSCRKRRRPSPRSRASSGGTWRHRGAGSD
jgi:acetyl esterase/lipase